MRLNSNSQSPRDGPGRGSLEKLHETGERAHCLTTKSTSGGACWDTKDKSHSSKELEIKYSQLTSQVQTLKEDIIRFNAETKGQIEPLLGLSARLDELLDSHNFREEFQTKSMHDRFDKVDERLDWLEEEYDRRNEVQPWVKQERYQSGDQKWKKKNHK